MIRIRLENVRCDRARPMPATVLIERKIGLIHVRPYRSPKLYTLLLRDVAESIIARVIRAEVLQQRIERARRRKEKAAMKKGKSHN